MTRPSTPPAPLRIPQAPRARPGPRVPRPDCATATFAHFAFSHGEFQCPFPAQEIAEVIARTGIEVLLDRLPGIDLSVPPQAPARRPSPFLRGMTVLPVEFTPTPAVYGGR